MNVAEGMGGPWMWLGVGMDVAGGRDGPWMWLGVGMGVEHHICKTIPKSDLQTQSKHISRT